MRSMLLTWATLLGCLTGCGRGGDAERDPHLVRIIAVAAQHVRQERPEWIEMTERPPVVREESERYVVTWELPPGTLGGSPVVYVDKKSFEAIELYHTQ